MLGHDGGVSDAKERIVQRLPPVYKGNYSLVRGNGTANQLSGVILIGKAVLQADIPRHELLS